MADVLIDRHDFTTCEELAKSLAECAATQLTIAIHERGRATLCISGHEELRPTLEALSKINIDWCRIKVFISDELFIPQDEGQLRENFVRAHLIQNFATSATLIGLFCNGKTADIAAFSASSKISSFSQPFDCTILDIAIDGSVASLLPGGDRISQGLNPHFRSFVLPMYASTARVPRLTMSLALLIQSRFIALIVQGKNKTSLIESIFKTVLPELYLPAQALIQYAQSDIQIFSTSSSQLQILETEGA